MAKTLFPAFFQFTHTVEHFHFRQPTTTSPQPFINLAVGAPDHGTLTKGLHLLHASSSFALSNPANHWCLQYGPQQGDIDFLTALANFLNREYVAQPRPVATESLMVTSGATSGLSLAVMRLLPARRVVLLEAPTYFLAGVAIKDVGAETVAVPSDEFGIIPEALEAKLRSLQAELQPLSPEVEPRPYLCGIYTVPTHGNPTGRVVPLARRQEILRLARLYDAVLLSDDVYNCLWFDGNAAESIPRYTTLDYEDACSTKRGHAVSIGSFAKLLGPGIRLGWLEATADIIGTIIKSGILHSGGALQQMVACALTPMLGSELLTLPPPADETEARDTFGRRVSHPVHTADNFHNLHEFIAYLRGLYRDRCAAMMDVLCTGLQPLGDVHIHQPEGGYFIWVTLPAALLSEKNVTTASLLPECRDHIGVGFTPGSWFTLDGTATNSFRVSFAHYEEAELRDACTALCRFWVMKLLDRA